MKLLFYEWYDYLQQDIYKIFRDNGVAIKSFRWKFDDKNNDERFENWFRKNIEINTFDALFSMNYWPLLSKVAQQSNVKYYALCYDNPLNVVRIEETLGNPVNTVTFFDRIQAKKYIDAGFQTVHYMPLGVNTKRLGRLILSDADKKRFSCDVSFVGSLYESAMSGIMQLMNEHDRGYVEAALAVQQNLYGCYLFDEMITEQFVEGVNKHILREHPNALLRLSRESVSYAMASEVTRRERLLLLSLFGRRWDTRLYSFHSCEILKDVKCYPPIDYCGEMPKVFACSKINLNPTLRCIQSGIPLRALDIMAAGGLLLSNYQPELAEYFIDQEELMIYESAEDAVEKAGFLLHNDDVRKRMIEAGRKKVFEQFSLENCISRIMNY